MKKLMMAAAIVCAAVAARASTCDWGMANDWAYSYNAEKGVNTYAAGTTAGDYWVVALTANSTAGISVSEEGELKMASSVGTTVAEGTFTYNSSGTLADITESMNGKYYALVIFDEDTGYYGISDTIAMSGVQDDPPLAGAEMRFSNHVAAEDGFSYMTANISTESVPEPTSGLLLLIGMAGLALRRRRA